MTINSSGSRLATGSNDYNVRLWDFNGMNRNMNSFRVVEPIPGHPIKSISFSADQRNILCVAGGTQIRLIDCDGIRGKWSIKGDMYLKDMN